MPITGTGTAWFLINATADSEYVRKIARTLELLPGVRGVTFSATRSLAYTRLTVHGTERGKRIALEVAEVVDHYEPDHNADHDHMACIVSARQLGVPEAYAHTPETYLSM